MDEAETSTKSSAAKNAIYHMDPYLFTIQIGFPLIGIPLNLLLAGTIVFNRQLQVNQNIAWLGCGFANVFFLSGFLIEVLAATANNSSVFLTLFNSIFGLPQACLVLFLHLSFLDRHIFFRYTLFYKKYANRAWIVSIQIICFVLVLIFIKGRFLYQSLTRSLPLSITEKEVSIVITSVFTGAALLYIPYKQLQETYIYLKKSKEKKTLLKNNSNSIESKSTSPPFENISEDCKNEQNNDTNFVSTARFDQTDYLKNNIHHKPNNEDRKNNQEFLGGEADINNRPINSFGSSESDIACRFEQSSEDRDANNYQNKATCTNFDENCEEKSSVSELQSYYSIKINIQVFFLFFIIHLIFLAFACLCPKCAILEGFLFDSCSSWFQVTFYLRGILGGFYTAMFNPLCFVGNSPDFVTLENTCNPTGRIARAIRCIIYLFANPPPPPCISITSFRYT